MEERKKNNSLNSGHCIWQCLLQALRLDQKITLSGFIKTASIVVMVAKIVVALRALVYKK